MERVVELLDSVQYRDDQTAVVHRKKLEKLLLRAFAAGLRDAANILHKIGTWDEEEVCSIQDLYARANRIEVDTE